MNSPEIKAITKKMNWKPFVNWQLEQIAYRSQFCSSCLKNKKCDICNCNVYDALSDILSCNKGKRFPKMVNRLDWEAYKKQNNIEVI